MTYQEQFTNILLNEVAAGNKTIQGLEESKPFYEGRGLLDNALYKSTCEALSILQSYQGSSTNYLVLQVQAGHLQLSQLIEERDENQASGNPDQDWLTSLNETINICSPQPV